RMSERGYAPPRTAAVRTYDRDGRAAGPALAGAAINHLGQPDDDLGKDDAEEQGEGLQRDEGHRGPEDLRHADIGRRDALQVEQRIAQWRGEERHLHVDHEDD